jgi:hypothetical protein
MTTEELKRHIEDKKKVKNFEEAIKELVQAHKALPYGEKTLPIFENYFRTEHRTLQQIFMKELIVPMIEAFAAMERSGSHDARNEASVEFARDVVAMMRENNTYFPYI